MTFRLAFALALFSFAVGGAAAASRSASLAPPSARFRPAAGWIVAKPTRSEQPDTFASMVIAVTAADIALLPPFAPFVGLKRLRPRAIIMWATTIGRIATSPFPPFPRASWPLRLSAFRIDRGWRTCISAALRRVKETQTFLFSSKYAEPPPRTFTSLGLAAVIIWSPRWP